MAGRDSQPKPAFFWQGALLVLPAVLLAALGLYFLERDRRLAGDEAREQAQIIARELCDLLKDGAALDENLSSFYHDCVKAAADTPRGTSRGHSVPVWDSRHQTEHDVPAQSRDEIFNHWPESEFGELWCSGGLWLSPRGELAALGWDRPGRPVAVPTKLTAPASALDVARLSPEQGELWDKARQAEFAAGGTQNADAVYRAFLDLAPNFGAWLITRSPCSSPATARLMMPSRCSWPSNR